MDGPWSEVREQPQVIVVSAVADAGAKLSVEQDVACARRVHGQTRVVRVHLDRASRKVLRCGACLRALDTHNAASHPLIVGFEAALKGHPLRVVTILLERLFRPLDAFGY